MALVSFLNLESELGDGNCFECFVLIDIHFLTVRDEEKNQVSFINALVAYDPLLIEVTTEMH